MKTCPGFCCFGSHGQEKGSDTSELGGKNIMAKFPYADVDWHLRALAGGAEGFGHFAIGGLHGPIYCVTTLADDGPGSLREGCRRKEPLWIVFEISGTINLSSYLSVSSYKTIDGRGQRVKLTGKGLRLKECEHIIVCNLEFEGGRGHDVDGIQIKPNSRHIWIDRCSLRDYDDGLIDITRQSTDITVSRCYFAQHDKTMLIGADPSHVGDRCIRVTIHHCFFDGTRQRQPRLRFGRVHLYNNYTRNWGIYAVCASVEAQIYSQCNIYEAGQKKKTFEYYTEKAFYDITDRTEVIHDPFQLEYVKSCNSLDFVVVNTVNEAGSVESASTLGFEATDRDEAKSGLIRSEGDMFLNGAQACLLTGVGEELVFHPSEHYPTWTYEAPSDSLKETLQICTGWQSIPRPAQMNL